MIRGIVVCAAVCIACILLWSCASPSVIRYVDAGNYRIALVEQRELDTMSDDQIAEYMIEKRIAFIGVANGVINTDGLHNDLLEILELNPLNTQETTPWMKHKY